MPETVRWLRFQDGGQSYAVEEDKVRSVESSDRLQLNPRPGGTAGWLLGIEGDLPVTSLARARPAGREPGGPQPLLRRQGQGGQVIVLQTGGGTAGLWVDSVGAKEEVPVSRLRRLPPVAETGAGLFRRMAIFPAAGASGGGGAGGGGEIVLEVAPEAIREQVAEGDFRPAAAAADAAGAGKSDAVAESDPDASTLGSPAYELPPAHGEGERRLLLFSTGRPESLPFGLNARQALEMLRPRQVRPVPGAPPYLVGLVSWRGEPIAALDLEVRLGLARDPAAVRRLLVIRSRDQEEVAAFVVDRIVTILQQPFRHRQLPGPAGVEKDLLRGVFEEAGHPFIVPDIDQVLKLPPVPDEPAEAPGNAPAYWA